MNSFPYTVVCQCALSRHTYCDLFSLTELGVSRIIITLEKTSESYRAFHLVCVALILANKNRTGDRRPKLKRLARGAATLARHLKAFRLICVQHMSTSLGRSLSILAYAWPAHGVIVKASFSFTLRRMSHSRLQFLPVPLHH